MPWITGRLRARTHDDYSEKIKRDIRPAVGKLRLSEVRPLDVQALYTAMAARDLAPRTIRYTHAILRSAFKQAVRWNMLVRNPCDAVELPRLERKEMLAFSREDVIRFLDSAKQDDHGVLFAFAVSRACVPKNTSH